MGGLCSKKAKHRRVNGKTASYATFNANEPPSKASLWKHRIQGDEDQQRKVSFASRPFPGATSPKSQVTNTKSKSTSSQKSKKPMISKTPSPRLSFSGPDPQKMPPPIMIISSSSESQSQSKPIKPTKSIQNPKRRASMKKPKSSNRKKSLKESDSALISSPARQPSVIAISTLNSPEVSEPVLDSNPDPPGPTTIDMDNDQQRKNLESNPPSSSAVMRPPMSAGSSASPNPGETPRKKSMVRKKSTRTTLRSPVTPSSKPSYTRTGPSTQIRSSKVLVSSRPSSRKRKKPKKSASTPSHKLKKSRSSKRTKSKASTVVKHEDSWTTMITERRRMHHHTKELSSRGGYLTDRFMIAKVEFEQKNGRLLRGIYREWENNNNEDENNGCAGRSSGSQACKFTNEVLDLMLDNMAAFNSSAPACNPSRGCSKSKPC